MSALNCLARAAQLSSLEEASYSERVSIRLVTNFTDTILGRLITGLALEANIYPELRSESYKNYHFSLAGVPSPEDALCDFTIFLFDANPYLENEFTSNDSHGAEICAGIARVAAASRGTVLAATIPLPTESVYANRFVDDPVYKRISAYNNVLRSLAAEHTNLFVFETDRIMGRVGEMQARDMRGMYAFDIPYTNEFTLSLARAAMDILFSLRGRTKKCIVVDLDNTLWGGVVGEVGTDGIALGPGYPGLAYENVQRVLKRYHERGILLAIASRNNDADIDDVFERHPHMQLKKSDFSSIQAQWGTKSESLRHISEELSIGLDSMVFIDDDPVNRAEVRAMLPMVVVPELSTLPETYASVLLSLPGFTQLTYTEEDRQKNEMYQQERMRHVALAEHDGSYLATLGITVATFVNDPRHDARLAQLSQKTNQFNLTTRRYSEADLIRLRAEGAFIIGASAEDRFGTYGIIALAIIIPSTTGVLELDTFLMSCRAIGRGVEYALLDQVLRSMKAKGYHTVEASFIRTAKNVPAQDFLSSAGFVRIEETDTQIQYSRSLKTYPDDASEATTNALATITISIPLP